MSDTVPPQKGKKVRKGQTAEEYQTQKSQFYSEGPTINTSEWLYETIEGKEELDEGTKTARVVMLHACEKAYFNRDYPRCLELVATCEQLLGISDQASLEQKEAEFQSAGIKVKKSAKIERHVLELLHIKEKCLEKLKVAADESLSELPI